ncbi:MAG: acetate kinase [Betaproteobacteria bacterium]|nr:acetate kinase [Betaproteobacteria bacterium]
MAELDSNVDILTLNCGSSTLKASLFLTSGQRTHYHYEHPSDHDHRQTFTDLLDDIQRDLNSSYLSIEHKPQLVIGHRFVHGGEVTDEVRLLDADEISRLKSIIHLAPLHMPGNLLGVEYCSEILAKQFHLIQFACFDTAFHATLPEIAYRLPIPNHLNIRRYGFHGLSYAHIARQLPDLLGETAHGKIVIAHLGSGASLCLLESLRSTDTSMGYTPAGGIPMGTRSGDLDPGIMLELMSRYNSTDLTDLVFHQMGLLALSGGESSEMSRLIASPSKNARFSVDFFARQVRASIGGFAAKTGGIDALIFTGGIGEHSAEIRTLICKPLGLLGFQLDETSNQQNATSIQTAGSKPILIIPADEEAEIARIVKLRLLA